MYGSLKAITASFALSKRRPVGRYSNCSKAEYFEEEPIQRRVDLVIYCISD